MIYSTVRNVASRGLEAFYHSGPRTRCINAEMLLLHRRFIAFNTCTGVADNVLVSSDRFDST